jgi:hypothetical protein
VVVVAVAEGAQASHVSTLERSTENCEGLLETFSIKVSKPFSCIKMLSLYCTYVQNILAKTVSLLVR